MEQSLMEKFADPALFETLTTGEKMTGALITTLMGLGITFLVLILLWGVIAVMTRVLKTGSKPKKVKEVETVKVTDEATGEAVTDGELIAVITAAIETYESANAVQSNLIIRKINRQTGRGTAWSRAGAQATIDGRNI